MEQLVDNVWNGISKSSGRSFLPDTSYIHKRSKLQLHGLIRFELNSTCHEASTQLCYFPILESHEGT